MRRFLTAGSILALALAADLGGHGAAMADDATTLTSVTVEARDPAGLLQRHADAVVFGIDKPLIETARQASFASAETLQRYGVESIDDLITLAPGAFTDSYYGVAGALNLRGTLAETYFRGFKRIENRGTYSTPLGAAEDVEVVRGPATANFGPSKVGGFLDFTPKTARVDGRFPSDTTGDVEIEGGSYDHNRIDAEVGTPVTIGRAQGGVFVYGEGEKDHSFYHGVYPSHELGQMSADFDFGEGWSAAFGGQIFHSNGDIQTPGWNRVTQALIDNGTYQAGQNTTLQAAPGAPYLSRSVIGPGGMIDYYFGFPPGVDPRFVLNSGVKTVTLSPRTVFVSNADFSTTTTNTFYGDLSKDLGQGQTVKAQLFYDDLSNQRFVSYGYPADYRAHVFEARLSWDLKRAFGAVVSETLAGAADRVYSGVQRENYNGGYLAPDRRDLSVGATPSDIMASPFSDPTVPWETAIHSTWNDAGVFALEDLKWQGFNLTLSGRYDAFDDTSADDGAIVYGATSGKSYSADDGAFSWSASLTWAGPFGLMPYVTSAHTESLELGQAGGIAPQLIEGKDWITASNLAEAGIKGRLLGDALTGSLGVYRQTRTELQQGNAVVGTRGEGAELEMRYLATRNLSFTFSGDLQRTEVLGPDTSLILVPPQLLGLTGVQADGGAYAIFNVSALRPGNYDNTLIPHAVESLAALYTTDRYSWGRAGGTLSLTHVSGMASILPGGFRLPAYSKANLSLFLDHGSWRIAANIDNLTDQRYFTPDADVLAQTAVLPGVGRTWRLSLKRSF